MSGAMRLAAVLSMLGACQAPDPPRFEAKGPGAAGPEGYSWLHESARTAESARRGDEIVVAGEYVSTGSPVVLWLDPGGYNAYSTRPHFGPAGPQGLRYRPGREGSVAPEAVAAAVDKFVLHYDACGVSRECFRVLHDQRELSVHFLIDVDGTIYQTLDVCETAWHARQANVSSVGVEIANIGAYPPTEAQPLARWYTLDHAGVRLDVPASLGDAGIRTAGFVGRPARASRIVGRIHGRDWVQYDFTPQQYEALARLTAALCRALPGLTPTAPRGPDGRVLTRALSEAEFAAFQGVLGHYHVTAAKHDPGPAFDWRRYLDRVVELSAQP